MKLVLFALCFALTAGFPIEWPFYSAYSYPFVVNATIGNPGQKVPFILKDFIAYHNFSVPDASVGGVFDPSASSTFKKIGILRGWRDEVIGIDGTDEFRVGPQSQSLGRQYIQVLTSSYENMNYGLLSINRPDDGSISFVQSLLAGSAQKSVVVVFDSIDPNMFGLENYGTMAIGGNLVGRCSGDYKYLQEHQFPADHNSQWAVQVDKLSVGRYTNLGPGVALTTLVNPMMSLPTSIYKSVLKELGSRDNYNIPCDAKSDIIFTLAGVDIRISPKDYIGEARGGGMCAFNGYEDTDFFTLPKTIFRNYCALFDFAAKRVGLAKKL